MAGGMVLMGILIAIVPVSVAMVLHGAGIPVDTVCEQGICASCITPYLDGTPDHQDSCLTEEERATHVAVCCARSLTPTLTLDI